ncbi:hypothetical protein [Actinomyces procaprae]|uniref:hypothetical protein n=1 Tax=Actinomyces procaprae TaxID=2560010 RepID=UPI00109DE7AC|nr:hypothetical protein [Actinomyces procaprae]
MVANPKRQALEKLSEYVSHKNQDLGFETNSATWDIARDIFQGSKGSEFSSAVNASDTWTGPLANTSAEDTKTDVDAVDTVFSDLLDQINAAITALPEELDESDPAANWPNESE